MTALTPYALEHIYLLQTLQFFGGTTLASLADELGRDPSNVRKTLIRLRADGFLQDMDLTDLARDALADYARMTGLSAAGAPPPVLHIQIRPDTLNPRKFTGEDEEGIAELAESIARDDLLENLVIRPAGADGVHRLVAGERRWRAIAKLIEDGRWARDKPVPVKIIDIDDAAHRRIALVENLQRKDLRPMDEARALKDLIDVTGMTTAQVAEEIGFTQRFVQQRLQFLELTDDQKEKLNKGELSIREARDLVAKKPKPIEDRIWLLALEIWDKVAAVTDNRELIVGLESLTDPDIKVLTGSPFWLNMPSRELRMGFETGFARTWVGGSFESFLQQKFGDAIDDADDRSVLLAQLQAANHGHAPAAGVYTTAWLNGPFKIDPDLLAQIEESEAARDRQREEDRKSQLAQRLRIEDAERAWRRHVGDRTADTLSTQDLVDLLTHLEVSLPLKVPDHYLTTSKGRPIHYKAANEIIAYLINRTCGVAA